MAERPTTVVERVAAKWAVLAPERGAEADTQHTDTPWVNMGEGADAQVLLSTDGHVVTVQQILERQLNYPGRDRLAEASCGQPGPR